MNDPLLLIDAYSQIFRAYYAVRNLTNSRGEAVNALYGFTKLLMRLEREYPGKRGALVFDCGRVQFRLHLIPEYKANRKPTPEDLKAQVPAIREMASAFGWPLEEEPEYEADDLIGALAKSYAGDVLIISADKDLSQLINTRVTQLIPSSKNGFEPRGVDEVKSKFGITPELVVDYLSLLGDAADNIPGAAGIGVKGAAELLNAYGPLPELLAHPERILEEKRREKLIRSAEILKRNIELIRLKTTLPPRLKDDIGCLRHKPDYTKIRELCQRHELNSILRDLERVAPEARAIPAMPPVATEPNVEDLFSAVAQQTRESAPKESEKMEQGDLFSF